MAQEVKNLSACSAGELGSIPGSGKSPGEGNGNPLQYSCLENSTDRGAWQTAVHGVLWGFPGNSTGKGSMCNAGDLGLIPVLERSLEEGMGIATHSSILVWRIPTDRGAWLAAVHGVANRWTQLSD